MQILFLGAPGAGKGTQCKRVAVDLQLPHLSSGDLLREAVKAGTAAGVKAKSFMDKGVLVPDDVLIDMFEEKLSAPECKNGFILDGFPRNVAQAEALDKLLSKIKKDLSIVIDLTVDFGMLTERITGRRLCSNKACNAPYHVKFAPSKKENACDLCGTELYQRSDDKEELVAERLKTYNEQTAPLTAYYSKRSILETVDGNGEQDAIFTELMKTINKKKTEIHA
ncbi:MAG: adenylate kinase [Candidatus Obscuribacterales bacterium]|jgi:adenylate kinase|nr:adenylate kinase [Candidatus Obscuribacterales bacterium]